VIYATPVVRGPVRGWVMGQPWLFDAGVPPDRKL